MNITKSLQKGWYFAIGGMNGSGFGEFSTSEKAVESFYKKIKEPIWSNWFIDIGDRRSDLIRGNSVVAYYDGRSFTIMKGIAPKGEIK